MIKINNFKITNDTTRINVSLEANEGETITKVLLWSNNTFQKYNLAKNLTSKLTQETNIEEFVIETSDMGISSFTGLFFMEVETSDQECNNCGLIGVAGNLVKYNECLLDKVLSYSICNGSDCKEDDNIINISVLLDSINICLQNAYYNEAIDLLKALDKLCPSCNNCNSLTTYCSNSGLNFATLNNSLILI